MGQYKMSFALSGDTLLFGRKTDDSLAGSWPQVLASSAASEEEKLNAARLNQMDKTTISRTLKRPEWNNTTAVDHISIEMLVQLKAQSSGDILVYGSLSVVQQLITLDVVDEYQLLTHPVLFGNGAKLSPSVTASRRFHLLKSQTHKTGVIMLYYAVI